MQQIWAITRKVVSLFDNMIQDPPSTMAEMNEQIVDFNGEMEEVAGSTVYQTREFYRRETWPRLKLFVPDEVEVAPLVRRMRKRKASEADDMTTGNLDSPDD
ncbi:hypothetical protein L249_4110 [Ophiocordyceps polyrhachis-furcata BCC 54312]|uniref:Uncharacterized protein n=1 Tax=Ophiocordyceps polyrhachis-furcata BCC 54312 TaxID=1330021 RepID=A0A367L5L4_9HYPO|nr:hypothetical protein L249_4110 [Ophiocordyceps polyrhachis-furcata BCC 54312]